MFEDDFPFSSVGYVTSPEGNLPCLVCFSWRGSVWCLQTSTKITLKQERSCYFLQIYNLEVSCLWKAPEGWTGTIFFSEDSMYLFDQQPQAPFWGVFNDQFCSFRTVSLVSQKYGPTMIRFWSLSWWTMDCCRVIAPKPQPKTKELVEGGVRIPGWVVLDFSHIFNTHFSLLHLLSCFWTLPPLCFERDSKVWNLELQNATTKLTLQRFLTEGCHNPGFWIENLHQTKNRQV